MVLNGSQSFLFSIRDKKWRRFHDTQDYHLEYNPSNLIDVNGSTFLFDNNKVRKLRKSTKNFDVVSSMTDERQRHSICKFSSDEVAIVGNETVRVSVGKKLKETLRSCYVYNTSFNRFRRIADLNVQRCGECLYCIGGFNSKSHLSSIEKYDYKINKWKSLGAKLKVARSHHKSVSHGELVVSLGGYNKSLGSLDSVEIFNTDSKKSTLIETRLKVPRYNLNPGCYTFVIPNQSWYNPHY